MIVCPRCGQDYLIEATIEPLDEQILICPECEAFWDNQARVSMETFRDFSDYVEKRGYKSSWNILKLKEQN